ncbi:fimbrial protein [Yersinia mollaretii]|uniref:fimbrial protein n=1 Tax=Yersinia mollaretii TaxID=33060 RepID=UPI0011A11C07|nr:fimbrial protein [Yersinia mollaretii]
MSSIKRCRKVALFAIALGMQGLSLAPAQAVTLNFAAVLNPGTCTLSLSQNILSLGSISQHQLIAGALLGAKPFDLNVESCTGSHASLTPKVNISGEGKTQGGKWLFRSGDSVASGMGVMLVKTETPPNYSQTEVQNGDDISLAAQGSVSSNQRMTFYAGVTCGDGLECNSLQPGELNARVLFNLVYR